MVSLLMSSIDQLQFDAKSFDSGTIEIIDKDNYLTFIFQMKLFLLPKV